MSKQEPIDLTFSALATDLDGTLIPLDHRPEHHRDLEQLRVELDQHCVELLFVTGRHLDSVLGAIEQYRLPRPHWIICDVGTSVYRQQDDGCFRLVDDYALHLSSLVGDLTIAKLQHAMRSVQGIEVQEAEKQGRFKLSYYADALALDGLVSQIEEQLQSLGSQYSVIASVDPFNQDGLIDLLPNGVSKAYALHWWRAREGHAERSVLFAGDSGNDLAALTAGYRSIVVANASDQIVEQVTLAHRQNDWHDRLFLACKEATSGVLEGFRHFLNES